MASWDEVKQSEPEFAAAVEGFLEARKHKTLATLRRDGSPRISGIESYFVDGHIWFGSMGGALKAQDLQRDPRFALHSGSTDPPDWEGDAKVAGTAEEIVDPQSKADWFAKIDFDPAGDEAHVFRADLTEVSLVRLNDSRDKLVIESWREGRGLRRIER